MTEQLFQVGVKAIIRRQDGKILLLREANHPDSYWDLPGGRMEPDETVLEALQRELQEEICSTYKNTPKLLTTMVAKKIIREARGDFALLLTVFEVELEDYSVVKSGEDGVVLEWFEPEEVAKKLKDKFPDDFSAYKRGSQ